MVVAAEQKETNLELKGIASDPDSANLFAVDKFSDMLDIEMDVLDATCNCKSSLCALT